MFKYKAPVRGFKYVQGLLDELKKLKTNVTTFSIQTRKYLFQ